MSDNPSIAHSDIQPLLVRIGKIPAETFSFVFDLFAIRAEGLQDFFRDGKRHLAFASENRSGPGPYQLVRLATGIGGGLGGIAAVDPGLAVQQVPP